jgi:hypothetical protein
MTNSKNNVLMLLILISVFCGSCTGATREMVKQTNTEENGTRTDNNGNSMSGCSDAWRKVLLPGIYDRTSEIQLLPLQGSEHRDSHSVEIRIWVGFGNRTLRGFVLTQTENFTKAYQITEVFENERTKFVKVDLPLPREDSGVFIQDSQINELTRLRDECESKEDELGREDAEVIVIESLTVDGYRAIAYEVSESPKGNEFAKIMRVIRFIESEFGISLI